MWSGMDAMGWDVAGLGMVHMALILALVSLGIFAIVKCLYRTGPRFGAPSALDILKARYANGELTRDEFERMRRELLA